MTHLGIDPGDSEGCAVILTASGRFDSLLHWKKRSGYWDCTRVGPLGGGLTRCTYWGAVCDEVYLFARAYAVHTAVVEGLAFGKRDGGRSTQSIVTLCEATGGLVAAAEQAINGRALRPLCQQWRKAVLGIVNSGAEPAKLAACSAVGGKPYRRQKQVRLACTLPHPWADIDHAAEAACMAEMGRM